jgi:hypothetical protein
LVVLLGKFFRFLPDITFKEADDLFEVVTNYFQADNQGCFGFASDIEPSGSLRTL